MKKLALILTLAALPSICLMQAQGPRAKSHRIVVPKGKTYVVLNAHGKETARYTAGQAMLGVSDCIKIKCPNFAPDTVCWECTERRPTPPPAARQ
jgi:hypothetical protein